jgi:hypothetical protein
MNMKNQHSYLSELNTPLQYCIFLFVIF